MKFLYCETPGGTQIERGGTTTSTKIFLGGEGIVGEDFEILNGIVLVVSGTINSSGRFHEPVDNLTFTKHTFFLRSNSSSSPVDEWKVNVEPQKKTLSFDAQDYPLAPMGRFDAVITLSESGVGTPGEIIPVTLPLGFTWSDGSTGARPFLTDSNGQVQINDVQAGTATGAHLLFATHASETATAQASVTPVMLGKIAGVAAFRIALNKAGTQAFVAGRIAGAAQSVLTALNTATGQINNAITVNGNIYGIALSEDSQYVYLARAGESAIAHSFIELDARTLTTTRTLDLNNFSPRDIALSPDRSHAYVSGATDPLTGFPNGRMAVVELNGLTLVQVTIVQNNPGEVAVSPNGNLVYVTNPNGNGGTGANEGTVSVINTSNYQVRTHIGVGSNPHGIVVSRNNLRIYTVRTEGNVLVVIDALTNAVLTDLNIGLGAWRLTLSDDGAYLCACEWNNAQTIAIVDTTALNVRRIQVPPTPADVAFSRDGRCVFVCNNTENSVHVIGI